MDNAPTNPTVKTVATAANISQLQDMLHVIKKKYRHVMWTKKHEGEWESDEYFECNEYFECDEHFEYG